MHVGIRDVKNHLSKYGHIAHNGETIVVTRNGQPWFDLVPHRKVARKTSPLANVKPTITLEEATAPIDEEDLPGWI